MSNSYHRTKIASTVSVLETPIKRRTLLRRSAITVLGGSILTALVAACGGDDDDDVDEPVVDDVDDEPEPISEDPVDTEPEPADEPDEPDSAPEPTPEPEPDSDDEIDDSEEPAADSEDEFQLPDGEPERPQSDAMAYGFNIAWRADGEGQQFNDATRQVVDTAGFNWVRFQIHWSEIQREPEWHDPLPVDLLVDTYEGSDIRILISVVGAPEWAMDPEGNQLLSDWGTFGDFMAFLADRYRGRVHAWEIWNEQNMAHEMHGTVRVSDYAYLLEAGFHAVKEADPEATVVFGGLTPTGINDPAAAVNDVDYLREFYNFEGGAFQQYFDVLGAHLNATNNPPETSYPDNPGQGDWTDDSSFYFLRGLDLTGVMAEFGDERSVWVTEFGWTTENMAEGYEYGADVSEEDQATYLINAFDVAREQMPLITGMFVWNLNFSTSSPPEDEKFPWAVLNDDWSPRPAYEALQQMPKP